MRTTERFPGVRWVGEPGRFIRVDSKKCTGCGRCLKVCLAGCFEVVQKTARITSLEWCMECSACWYICPEDAVEFSWPKGGSGFHTRYG